MPKPQNTEIETPETEVQTPASEPAQAPATPVTDTFAVTDARVNLRGDEDKQGRYNLLITDQTAIDMLEALGKETGFKAANDNGQHYVSVTMDARSVMEMRRAGGFKALLVTGELTIVDIDANNRPVGHMVVAPGGVQKASLLNGGIVKARTTTKEVVNTRPTLGGAAATGLRSVSR